MIFNMGVPSSLLAHVLSENRSGSMVGDAKVQGLTSSATLMPMSTPTVLFPANPLNERQVDPEFEREWAALQFAGVQRALVAANIEQERFGGAPLLRYLPEDAGKVLYRGWMLSANEYAIMSQHLQSKGFELIATQSEYLRAHWLFNWLDAFDGLTPRTMFVNRDASNELILEAGRRLGVEKFVVKDYVKSRKHEWETAAYAPSVQALPQIVREFVRLQGEFLVGDVAIRQFVELDRSAGELRLWWANGELAMASAHPDTPGEVGELLGAGVAAHTVGSLYPIDLPEIQKRVRQLDLPFVTTDVALKAKGGFVVIEVGDGQVSGLPEGWNEDQYASLITKVLAD
jgi:hypothetical protein